MLDLDHTLVNSARFGEVEPHLAARLDARLAADAAPPEQRELHRLPRIGMWTKLRPGALAFLAAAAPRFELWIHTNGTRCAAGPAWQACECSGSTPTVRRARAAQLGRLALPSSSRLRGRTAARLRVREQAPRICGPQRDQAPSRHADHEAWAVACVGRSYAHAMCELLDPDGALFGDRIIAAGASTAGDGAGGGLNKRLMQVRVQMA